MRIFRKGLGIFLLSVFMGTLYAGLVGLISKSLAGPLISWPIWIGIFWFAFSRFALLRYTGFMAVLPVSLLAFEAIWSIRYPGMNADRHRSFDRSHYTPGLRVAAKFDDSSEGVKEILIGSDGFRADPKTGRGNPERCRFVLIGDSMIYGTELAYSFTLGPVLAEMGFPACIFGVTGNSPVDYLATLNYVTERIEPGAYVAFYIYAYNDFVSLSRFVQRGILSTSNTMHKLFEWVFYFDRWRKASWTYSFLHVWEGLPPVKPYRYEINKKQEPIKILFSRDPAAYVKPKPLNQRQRAAFRLFLERLNEFLKGRQWRVSILIHPDHSEIYANFARQSTVFVDLDPRRAEGLKMCKEFSFHCEDISRTIYERSFAAGKNPYLEHDRHFSSFGTRIVAEHFAALTKRALPPGER